MYSLSYSSQTQFTQSSTGTQFSQTFSYSQSINIALSQQGSGGSLNDSLREGLKQGLGIELRQPQIRQPQIRQAQNSVQQASTQKGLAASNEGAEVSEAKTSPIKFDIDKVVDTVMQFVEKRVVSAKDEGASDGEVESLLDSARSGVEKGFSQAREQIDALNKLNDDLAQNIDSAEDGIYQGIDDLQARVLPESPADDGVVVSVPSAPATPQNTNANKADDKPAPVATAPAKNSDSRPASTSLYANSYQRNTETFDFQLTTRDGDVVTISAFRDQAAYAELYVGANGSEKGSYGGLAQAGESGFSLQVDGDLDEDELLAIQDLLGQVDALAEEFYTGDLETAFKMALELESDPNEIAKFSLDLSQTQTSYIEAAQFVPSSYEANPLPRGLAEPLADFAKELRDTFESARQISQQPAQLLQQLFSELDTQNNISGLLDPLLTRLDQQQAALDQAKV